MSTIYASGRRHPVATAKEFVARFGLKAGIIVLGGAIAVGTVHRTTYLPRTTVGQAISAANPADSASLIARLSRATKPGSLAATSSTANGELNLNTDHGRVDQWVNRLSMAGSGFATTLGRMEKYGSMIKAKLEAKDMPKDLVYLAAIESEFNPNAKSPVKALGLWQFMSGTARRFGLKVSGHVDERRDPVRETDAALDYLAQLHDRFGSWYLAAAAYNSGEGTVLHALRKVTGKDTGTDDDFFKILPALPKETQDYVPKLIAAAKIGNSPETYGVTPQAKPVVEVKDVVQSSAPAHATRSKHAKVHAAPKTHSRTASKHTTSHKTSRKSKHR